MHEGEEDYIYDFVGKFRRKETTRKTLLTRLILKWISEK
jgi:hypothetical protein